MINFEMLYVAAIGLYVLIVRDIDREARDLP